ncbi:hypothetical protein EYF80_005421 [Liparis tanakae]|uniref:Uncharacterized protein n=1 Tax=Liparis tanakae TaxID=230148 RepID=A0A4Z2J411_9TELE|nr:hypothetical protein EYF80_005421 [Liparis tanakae]
MQVPDWLTGPAAWLMGRPVHGPAVGKEDGLGDFTRLVMREDRLSFGTTARKAGTAGDFNQLRRLDKRQR